MDRYFIVELQHKEDEWRKASTERFDTRDEAQRSFDLKYHHECGMYHHRIVEVTHTVVAVCDWPDRDWHDTPIQSNQA
jgi:hypothetical protein